MRSAKPDPEARNRQNWIDRVDISKWLTPIINLTHGKAANDELCVKHTGGSGGEENTTSTMQSESNSRSTTRKSPSTGRDMSDRSNKNTPVARVGSISVGAVRADSPNCRLRQSGDMTQTKEVESRCKTSTILSARDGYTTKFLHERVNNYDSCEDNITSSITTLFNNVVVKSEPMNVNTIDTTILDDDKEIISWTQDEWVALFQKNLPAPAQVASGRLSHDNKNSIMLL